MRGAIGTRTTTYTPQKYEVMMMAVHQEAYAFTQHYRPASLRIQRRLTIFKMAGNLDRMAFQPYGLVRGELKCCRRMVRFNNCVAAPPSAAGGSSTT